MSKKGLVISLVVVAVLAGLATYKYADKLGIAVKAPAAKTAPAAAQKAPAPKAAPAAAQRPALPPLTDKQRQEMRARFAERFQTLTPEEKQKRIEMLTRALERPAPNRSERAKEVIQLQLEVLQGK